MSNAIEFSDYCTSTLVAAANNFQTTLLIGPVTDSLPVMTQAGSYFYLTIVDAPSYNIDLNPPAQREIVKVTAYVANATGYALTVVRGITTDAQVWAAGSYAEIRPCAQALYDLKDAGGGGASPLTTKGDVYGFSTVDARIPVGTNDQVLTADSTQALGVKWATPATGSGAPVDATYVTMSLNGTLTNERVLTAGSGISIVDNGANSTVVITATAAGSTLQSQEFTASGTFTVPTAVSSVWLTMLGGGGGGGGSIAAAGGGGGGGAGELLMNHPVIVTPGASISVVVPAAAAGGNGANGATGGDVTFNATTIAKGGGGGHSTDAGGISGGGLGGAGGGVGGAAAAAGAGVIGAIESVTYFGGGRGGGGGTSIAVAGFVGCGAGGYPVGAAGGAVAASQAGGGGGAATIYGLGGIGAAGGGNGTNATVIGTGGGGGGGKAATSIGGSGGTGYCLVQWVG